MFALSLHQPWAELLVLGLTTVEIRGYNPRIPPGTQLAIQATKALNPYPQSLWEKAGFTVHEVNRLSVARLRRRPPEASETLPGRMGVIVGVVTLASVEHLPRRRFEELAEAHLNPVHWYPRMGSGEQVWGWRMRDPIRLDPALPCRGQQKVWTLTDPFTLDVRRAVERAEREQRSEPGAQDG